MLRIASLLLCGNCLILGAQGNGHVVTGMVVDRATRPVAGAHVFVRGARDTSWGARTDSAGRYRIAGLPDSIEGLTALTNSGWLQGSIAHVDGWIHLRAPVTEIDFRLLAPIVVIAECFGNEACEQARRDAPDALTGVVTDSVGVPISRALVTIPETFYRTTTDSAGRYHFRDIPVSPFSLRAVAQDFKPRQIDDVAPDGRTLTIDFVLYPFIESPSRPAVAPPAPRR